MKKRYINLLTVVLSTTVLLGGCGGTKIYSASAADISEMSSLISDESSSESELFSDRDLSGEYDTEGAV